MNSHSHDWPSLPVSVSGPITEIAHPQMEEAARLAEMLAANWHRGHCCTAEELLAEHPEILTHSQAALRVVYEEVCQRQELGQDVSLTELHRRFPQWRDQLAVLFDCIRLLGLTPRVPRYPVVGETLGSFRLLAELGRGGRGRVYLAEQTFLAGRLMILKLIPLGDQEHLNLARLQHTHIVPLYSVRDFPDRNLRKLCMPCLGGATLQQLLRTLRPVLPEKRAGKDLLLALRSSVADPSLYWRVQGPNRRFLERASYVQAICWMGVCLADALNYAHEQNLIHLDVKPSNVLLTADWQPMLLDFHLARSPIRSSEDRPDRLGGTPGYMSPEQRAALRACWDRLPIPGGVDARSDVYSLGLLLREALYGELSEDESLCAAKHLPARSDVSTGLRDVLARCLCPDPDRRYPSAAHVAEDLRRHLTDRPLLSVRNRSLAERWRKWRRRRPQALLLWLLATFCLAGPAAFGGLNIKEASQRQHEAEEALNQGRRQAGQHRYTEAVSTFDWALKRLGGEGVGTPLHTELQQQRKRAARLHDVEALHIQVERARYLHGDELLSRDTLHMLEAQCRRAWEQRDRLLAAEEPTLRADVAEMLRRDLLDVGILWVDCQVRLAAPAEVDDARREGLRVLNEAESLFGPSPVLSRERHALATTELVGTDEEPAPHTAWEHYSLGRWLLRNGDLEKAAVAFDRAVELRPQDFWPWFSKGFCAHCRERPDEAVTAFTVCIALAPDSAICYYNRGLALAACGDTTAALRDYDNALRLDTHLAAAALNRGVLQFQQRHFTEAEDDFRLALKLGANPAAVYYNWALLHQAWQEPMAGLKCLDQALEFDPNHRLSCHLHALLRKQLQLTAPMSK